MRDRPFKPADDEHALYEAVSGFLQRENSYALPQRQRHLTALILRKLLASSSQAIAAILWLLADGKQHVIFVDPKGIRNIGWDDPKIRFHETVKEIERRLGDSAVHLQFFIVSNTSFATMRMLWNKEKHEMLERNVLFQEEDRDSYVKSMLTIEGNRRAAR